VYIRWEGASRRFSGITGEVVEAAAVGAFGRVGRELVVLAAGVDDAFCCGVVGNDERIRGVPLMA